MSGAQQIKVVLEVVEALRPEVAPPFKTEEERADDRVDVDEPDQRNGGKYKGVSPGREAEF